MQTRFFVLKHVYALRMKDYRLKYSFGRALHWHRVGHGFKSHLSLNFFWVLLQQSGCVVNCDNLFFYIGFFCLISNGKVTDSVWRDNKNSLITMRKSASDFKVKQEYKIPIATSQSWSRPSTPMKCLYARAI